MEDFKKTFESLEERRQRVIDGKFNGIPYPYEKLRNDIPVLEKGKYIVITANQKVGKSKLADDMFVYNSLFFTMEHPEVKVHIIYFTFEMAKEVKKLEFLSHLLLKLDNIILSPNELKSIDRNSPIKEDILKLLQSDKYKPYIDKFSQIVDFIDNEKNPTGIRNNILRYAKEHGKFVYKDQTYIDKNGIERRAIDHYQPNDPEEFVIVILDNASNITPENNFPTKRDAIEKVSKDFIDIRNTYDYDLVLIQHQAQDKEGNDSFKLNRLEPSSDGLADCKTTTRDVNQVFGLFDPYKYGKKTYEGYNMKDLCGYTRFLKVCEDRDYGASNSVYPLIFNGASSHFNMLCPPDDKRILSWYKYAERIQNKEDKSKYSDTLDEVSNNNN